MPDATAISAVDRTIAAQPQERGLGSRLGGAVAIAVMAFIWFAPLPLEPRARHALAISAFMAIAWMTYALEYALVGFIGCFLFWSLRVVRFEVAFSGFANDTPWFIFGAMLFGAAATKSGLAKRVSHDILNAIGTSYSRILLGLIISDLALTFIVPSGVARIVIMASIAIGLIEAFGCGLGSNIGRGMFIILTYCAALFDKMIIAGAASILSRGLIEQFGHVNVLWSQWFIAYLPCELITILVAWRLTLKLYPPEKAALPDGTAYIQNELRKMGPWSSAEKRAAALIALGIGLWLTDFLHGIPAPMVGIGVGLLATIPGVGVLDVEDVKTMNYFPVFFVAAAISMGQVLAATGALDVLAKLLVSWMAAHVSNVYGSTLVLYWTAFVYHLPLGDETVMLSTSLPVVMQFAATHGLRPLMAGMVWVFASGAKIFVYQAGPVVMGYSFGYFSGRDMLRVGALLTVIECLILLLLVPWYWPLVGIR